MQLTGKNTGIAGKNTRQTQAKITANAGKNTRTIAGKKPAIPRRITSNCRQLQNIKRQLTQNLENRLFGFQKESKTFTTTSNKKRLEGKKRQRVKLHCFPKAYQSILQNHMAKKYTVKLVPLLDLF